MTFPYPRDFQSSVQTSGMFMYKDATFSKNININEVKGKGVLDCWTVSSGKSSQGFSWIKRRPVEKL